MASSSSPYSEMSFCLVCKGTLTDPRLLPCFHTFCFHCIMNNSTTTTPLLSDPAQNLNTLHITCPKCREEYRYQPEAITEMLPKDTFAGQLSELARIKDQFLLNRKDNNNSNNSNSNVNKKQDYTSSKKSQKSTKVVNLQEGILWKPILF